MKHSKYIFLVIVLLYATVIGVLTANAQDVGPLTMHYVNEARAERGLSPLKYSYALEDMAAWYNDAMVRRNEFAHGMYSTPEEQQYLKSKVAEYGEWEVIANSRYYQDIAYQKEQTTDLVSPQYLASVFDRSEPHSKVLYRPEAVYIGIDMRPGYNRIIATFIITNNREGD